MIPDLRAAFNAAYSDERYQSFVADLTRRCGVPIEFRLSETPCFFPAALLDDLTGAARVMIQQLLKNDEYRRAADAVVPPQFQIPRGEQLPTFIQVDFGLLRVGGRLEGRLVELQAFPSLYGFQLALAEASRDAWNLENVSIFPAGLDRDSYLEIVGKAILGGHNPANVVLMEIDPDRQKTLPDFRVTEQLWGVRTVDVRAVTREARWLFYERDGRKTMIRRVYNRLIPDDIARLQLDLPFDYRDDMDVEWAGGPDWFYRVSKFSIPWLKHPWVPETRFLSDVARVSGDRSVLKPLFSYAGGGIVFSPTEADIAAIPEEQRLLYLLQERVPFTPVIDTPDGPTQAEIRLMFVRNGDDYRFVLPLVRMGRGKMMGVDHNKGLKFVGAAAAFIS